MKTKRCLAELIQITPLTNSILQLKLKPKVYIDYKSGQYLNILIDEEVLSYSIANAPLGVRYYELHIRHSGGNPYRQPLFSHLKQYGHCKIELPFGECYLDNLDPKKPIIFIANGTGFAPVKAMIEEMLASEDERQIILFWGAKEACDIYQEQLVEQWQEHVDRFQVKTIIDSKKEHGFIKEIFNIERDMLSKAQFVISGPFPLVYTIRDWLVKHGLSADTMHSDAFSFEIK